MQQVVTGITLYETESDLLYFAPRCLIHHPAAPPHLDVHTLALLALTLALAGAAPAILYREINTRFIGNHCLHLSKPVISRRLEDRVIVQSVIVCMYAAWIYSVPACEPAPPKDSPRIR